MRMISALTFICTVMASSFSWAAFYLANEFVSILPNTDGIYEVAKQ